MGGMTDPFAPPARFPDDRLSRAGLDADTIDALRADFDDSDPATRSRFALHVAAVSDADLANPDGSTGPALAAWPPAAASADGRELTDQEKAQAGQDPTDGTVKDLTYPLDHTVPEVEAYLAGLTGTGVQAEVQRVLDAEQARTDRDPRVGVVAACQDFLDGS